VQIGIGVKTAAVYRITTQGNLTQTSNPLDLAIQGRGFFQILQPDGTTAYTRAGSFQLSPTGEIVTADGFIVQPGITLPQNTLGVTINPSGQVLAQVAGQTTPQTVGQLQLANFANEAGLEALGSNLFVETPASGSPVTGNPGAVGFGTLNQGLLETSNVDVVSEITNLITAQRAYEMNSKVIQTSDQMMSTLNQIQ
jgi:flagellar basal-body rod protein FlgG